MGNLNFLGPENRNLIFLGGGFWIDGLDGPISQNRAFIRRVTFNWSAFDFQSVEKHSCVEPIEVVRIRRTAFPGF